MLRIKIFDVAHGNCAYVVTPNNQTIMIDAGHDGDNGMFPWREIRAHHDTIRKENLTLFVNSNADHDHVSNLHEVYPQLSPRILRKNPTIDSALINREKEQPLTNGLEALCTMCDRYTSTVADPDFGGVTVRSFHTPFADAGDTNNASLATFVNYGSFSTLFPGDLEAKGWRLLLQQPDFVEMLKGVTVFVASHHGRENGYCPEVFTEAGCNPFVFIVSDKVIEHGTQEHNHYAQHARGFSLKGQERKVLTTRRDGAIYLESNGLDRHVVSVGEEARMDGLRAPAL